MDWVGPATTASVAFLVGAYLARRAKKDGSINRAVLRRILLVGGAVIVAVALVVSRLTA